MEKAELVLIPLPGISHLVSMMELAKLLISRSDCFSITVLVLRKPPSFPTLDTYIQSIATSINRIRFIHLPHVEPPSQEISQSQSGETRISIMVENLKSHIKHTITKLASSDGDGESKSVPIAGLVIDLFCTTLIDIANELGVPSYIYFASTAAFLGLMLHVPTLHIQIATDFKDSNTGLIIPSFLNPVPPSVFPLPLWEKKNDGYNWYLFHGRRFREAKGIIINTFTELEPSAVDSLSNGQTPPVYPIGPLLDLQGQTHLAYDRAQYDKIMKWLDDQPLSSVILLCFGNVGSFSGPQVKEIALGLERSEHRFLWSLREPPKAGLILPSDYSNLEEALPDGFLERTEGKGLVCGWVPQVAVMGHRAIGGFVSHCGWNSILESIWFGVPIVAWPLYAEQHLNAFEMVREMGGLVVEMRLDYRGGGDLVTAEEVERGVRCVMDVDCEVRRRAKEMSVKSREAVMEGGSSFASLGRLIENMMDTN